MQRILLLVTLLGFVRSNLNAQWIQQNSGTMNTLYDVVMLTAQKAIAVGRAGAVSRTTNAGTTWIYQSISSGIVPTWYRVSFFDTLNGIIVGDKLLAKTTDGGESWSLQATPDGRVCYSALYLDSYNIFVGADSGWVFHSQDSGTTWTSEKISAWPIYSIFAWRGAIIPEDGEPIYALTPISLCSARVYPAGPWSEQILLPFSGLGSCATDGEFSNGGGPGFIVGVGGDLQSTTVVVRMARLDTAWRLVGLSRTGGLTGVSAPSESVAYVCGSGGMIFNSKDGGDTWSANYVPTTKILRAIYFYEENHGFAVGDSGVVLYTENGGVTGVREGEGRLPLIRELDDAYPNPFNPSTIIRYSLPGSSYVALRVYNVLGQEVATLVNERQEPGSKSVEVHANGWPSGVYFYRLSIVPVDGPDRLAISFSETKKFILTK